MVKYFWIKDFENAYRIIEKRKNRDEKDYLYSCVYTGVTTSFINEKNFFHKISSPLMFHNISSMDNKDELFSSILRKMQFNNQIFENILIDIFVNGLNYDDISKKHKKCKPSISRIVKKFKSFYYCPDCSSVHPRDENIVLSEGYYWAEINDTPMIVFLSKENNRFSVKCFGLKKGMIYDIDFIKTKLLFKIEEPIDKHDILTEDGVNRKIRKIENEGRIYNSNTKKAVVETIMFNRKLSDSALKHKVNASNISRLRKKVLSTTCFSCGNVVK
jgi:hypothetical protein